MFKDFVFFLLLLVFRGITVSAQDSDLPSFAASILPQGLRQHVETLSSPAMQGRETNSDGGRSAAKYIADWFAKCHLKPYTENSYFQHFESYVQGVDFKATNVIGYIEGYEFKDEAIVLSAHYDHFGMWDGISYPGADDNASGVAALLEIAVALSFMRNTGYYPRRTIVFIAFDAKEKNMSGSEYYTKHPLHAMEKTIANLNMDVLGRTDVPPEGVDENYVLIVGADRETSGMRDMSNHMNKSRDVGLHIDYSYYGSQTFSELMYLISDQMNFGKYGVPVMYYTSGMHDDLYKPTDTADKINYEVLKKRAQLIFYTTWGMSMRSELFEKDLRRGRRR